MRKQIGSAPQQSDTGFLLLCSEDVDDFLQIAATLRETGTFRAHIGIMEAVERHAQEREHFEGNIRLQLGILHRVAEPWPLECLPAKRVATLPRKGMPIGNGKAKMIFHALAHDDLVTVIVAKCQRIDRIQPLIGNLCDVLEKPGAHCVAPLMAG